MNKNLLFIVVFALAVVGYVFINRTTNTSSQTAITSIVPTTTNPTETTSVTKSFSLTEIATHATETDCWFAVDGNVYDVTPFIKLGKHGGGDAILEGCGKDATILFTTRPMGSGTPHSEKAKDLLKNYYIGILKNE